MLIKLYLLQEEKYMFLHCELHRTLQAERSCVIENPADLNQALSGGLSCIECLISSK